MAKEDNKRVSRGMPNNVDAEASVLGAILIDNKAADIIIPMLNVDDFYLAQNRLIFAVMKQLQMESKPIDTVSVCDALDVKGQLDEVGSLDCPCREKAEKIRRRVRLRLPRLYGKIGRV